MATSFRARRIACALILAVVAAAWLQLARARDSEAKHAELLVQSMAHAVARQIGGSLGAIDQVLLEAAEAAASGRWDEPARREQLAHRLRALPEVRYVGIVDSDGRMRTTTVPAIGLAPEGRDVSDRSYVKLHREGEPDRPRVGDAIIGRATGERSIPLSRPWRDASGRRMGTVVAMVAADHYASLLAENMLETEGATAIIRLDGIILARSPDHARKFGSSIAGSDLLTTFIPRAPAGAHRLVSVADGNDKFVGYYVLEDYQLVVTSGMTLRTALRSWRTMAGFEIAVIVVLAGLMLHWGWQTDRRESQMLDHQGELERKVAERTAALEAATRLAEQRAARISATHATLSRLAQVTAHHLQEPVRPMVSFAQLARRSLAGDLPEVRESLDFVEAAGLRLKSTLMAFQQYVELLGGTPRRVSVDTQALCTRLACEVAGKLAEIDGTLDAQALPVVIADERMIAGALRELIANAIQFRHPERPLRIVVRGEEHPECWRISVADNGCGIDDAVRPRLFEPFLRHQLTDANASGLGLAMCQAIAQAHGGGIAVDSSPEGSTFTMELARWN